MNDIAKRFTGVLTLLALTVLSACGGPVDSSDPERMARESPPEHNPEATYQGRTAQEYAQWLGDRSQVRQSNALDALGAMGVDGLPARQSVRGYIEEIDSRSLDPVVAAHLEIRALAALARMQAPEAAALIRQRIIDPGFSERLDDYTALIDLAAELGIEPETLVGDVQALADSAPEHGGVLLRTDALPNPARESLGQTIFVSDHDEVMVRYFLAHLANFNFIEEAAALDYVRANIGLAREDIRASHAALASIGSEAALDLALVVSESDFGDDPGLISRFALSQMGPERAMERMLAAIMETDSRQKINTLIDGVASISRNLVHAANNDETSMISAESAQQLHVNSLTTLIEQGPSADHRIAGAERLLRHVQLNQDLQLSPTLDPVFDIAGSPEESFETRIAVQRFMSRTFMTLPARDSEYLFGKAVGLLWAGNDAETTEIPASMLAYARRSPEHARIVIGKIHASMDSHLDQWTVNPAAAVILNVAGISQLDRRPAREQGSIVIGQLIASPAAELEYLKPHLIRHMKAIADFNSNTVVGLAGLIGPTIFAEHQAIHRQFEAEAFASILQRRPGWFRDEPESVEEWKHFLAEVANARVEHFSASAQSALKGFE